METIARRIRVTGRVQGVGFRAFALRQAHALGLDGFVRNRADGSVEALVAGEGNAVAAWIARCHEGPPGSQVDRVDTAEAEGIVERGFRQLPTV